MKQLRAALRRLWVIATCTHAGTEKALAAKGCRIVFCVRCGRLTTLQTIGSSEVVKNVKRK